MSRLTLPIPLILYSCLLGDTTPPSAEELEVFPEVRIYLDDTSIAPCSAPVSRRVRITYTVDAGVERTFGDLQTDIAGRFLFTIDLDKETTQIQNLEIDLDNDNDAAFETGECRFSLPNIPVSLVDLGDRRGLALNQSGLTAGVIP